MAHNFVEVLIQTVNAKRIPGSSEQEQSNETVRDASGVVESGGGLRLTIRMYISTGR